MQRRDMGYILPLSMICPINAFELCQIPSLAWIWNELIESLG